MIGFLSLLLTIRHEILIMYYATISDWMTTIIPPILMAIGVFYMRVFSSIATYNYEPFEILFCYNRINQITAVEEDRINKPFRPIPSGLITVKGARYRLVAISIIFPIIAYIFGGLSLVFLCFLYQAWVIFNEMLKLSKNAFYKNLFSAFSALIQLVSCHYIIIGTKLSIFELLNSELGMFMLGIFFFAMTTAHVQDFRDQKGDKFVGRKTFPLLIGDNICRWFTILMLIISLFIIYYISNNFLRVKIEKNFEGGDNNGFAPHEFNIIEFILIVLNASSCIRLFIYRQPKQDNITYQKWYSGFFCTLFLYYGMCINYI
ncbi:UbiA prenyltransferase family protein [Gigaspora margarita]|uniref:UbiA prenyltransferase family protein n=1 Tax=Gigaspora margarita TaxID=4874 RepID=A0A8H3WUJ1_GIGMA|nr:UbiA prenyltransferase family protein [Gigaspora margarita]